MIFVNWRVDVYKRRWPQLDCHLPFRAAFITGLNQPIV